MHSFREKVLWYFFFSGQSRGELYENLPRYLVYVERSTAMPFAENTSAVESAGNITQKKKFLGLCYCNHAVKIISVNCLQTADERKTMKLSFFSPIRGSIVYGCTIPPYNQIKWRSFQTSVTCYNKNKEEPPSIHINFQG